MVSDLPYIALPCPRAHATNAVVAILDAVSSHPCPPLRRWEVSKVAWRSDNRSLPPSCFRLLIENLTTILHVNSLTCRYAVGSDDNPFVHP